MLRTFAGHSIEPSVQVFVPLLRGTLQGKVVFHGAEGLYGL
jgi:hypothetical protein